MSIDHKIIIGAVLALLSMVLAAVLGGMYSTHQRTEAYKYCVDSVAEMAKNRATADNRFLPSCHAP